MIPNNDNLHIAFIPICITPSWSETQIIHSTWVIIITARISVNWGTVETATSTIITHAANKIAAVTQHMNQELPVGLGLLGFAPGLALGLMRG